MVVVIGFGMALDCAYAPFVLHVIRIGGWDVTLLKILGLLGPLLIFYPRRWLFRSAIVFCGIETLVAVLQLLAAYFNYFGSHPLWPIAQEKFWVTYMGYGLTSFQGILGFGIVHVLPLFGWLMSVVTMIASGRRVAKPREAFAAEVSRDPPFAV